MKRWKIGLLFIFILVGCGQAGNEVVEIVESANTPESTATSEPMATVTFESTATEIICRQVEFDGTLYVVTVVEGIHVVNRFDNGVYENLSGELDVTHIIGYLESKQELIFREFFESNIYAVGIDGTNLHKLSDDYLVMDFAEISSDEKTIMFSMSYDFNNAIYIFDIETGTFSKLIDGEYDDLNASWNPSGGKIAYVSRNELVDNLIILNMFSGETIDITYMPGEYITGLEWSPDGKHLAYISGIWTSQNVNLYVYNVEKKTTKNLTEESGKIMMWYNWSVWSPDSSMLSVALKTARDQPEYIYTISIDDGEKYMVTEGNRDVSNFRWSPDGEYALYIANNDETGFKSQLFVNNLDGCQSTQITFHEDHISSFEWIE